MANDATLKHLEFIQSVIARMNANSFMLKGWSVTLVSALFALAAKDAKLDYVLVSWIPIPIFCMLDAYYLAMERRYRDLFKKVSDPPPNDVALFDMDASKYSKGYGSVWSALGSSTIWLFYLGLAAVVLVVMFLIPRLH